MKKILTSKSFISGIKLSLFWIILLSSIIGINKFSSIENDFNIIKSVIYFLWFMTIIGIVALHLNKSGKLPVEDAANEETIYNASRNIAITLTVSAFYITYSKINTAYNNTQDSFFIYLFLTLVPIIIIQNGFLSQFIYTTFMESFQHPELKEKISDEEN